MRNGIKDVEYELASVGCRVDWFLKADQLDLSDLEVIDGFQKLFERADQAIEAEDSERINNCLLDDLPSVRRQAIWDS